MYTSWTKFFMNKYFLNNYEAMHVQLPLAVLIIFSGYHKGIIISWQKTYAIGTRSVRAKALKLRQKWLRNVCTCIRYFVPRMTNSSISVFCSSELAIFFISYLLYISYYYSHFYAPWFEWYWFICSKRISK